MQHNSKDFLNISQRIMCCLVALFLILSLSSMPIKVSAANVDNNRDVYFSGGGGAAVELSAGVAALAVMVGAAGKLLDNGAERIINLWNNLSSSVKSWFEHDAIQIFEGSAVRVPDSVVDELEEKAVDFSVSFPVDTIYLRPLEGTIDLSSFSFNDVYATNLMDLMQHNLSLLNTIELALSDFRYDSYFQYKVMHDAFYDQIVETRLALRNTFQSVGTDIYNRLGNVSTLLQGQFLETGQAILNKIDSVSTPINNNITKVRDQIVDQLTQLRVGINSIDIDSSSIFERLGNVSKLLEGQFLETRQALLNKIDSVSTPINNNITKVRDQIVDQLVQLRVGLVDPLSGIKSVIDRIDIGSSSIFERLGNVSKLLEGQFLETRQALLNKIDSVSTPIYNNITKVRDQIVGQLVQTRTAVLNAFDSINARIDSLAGQISTGIKDGLSDVEFGPETDVVLPSTLPGISSITGTLADVIPGIKNFFNDPGDDDRRYPTGLHWLPKFMNGENNYFWQMLNDSAFMSAIQSFFNFVAALWLLFPLAVRYLIIFGFGAPLFVSTAKMLVG